MRPRSWLCERINLMNDFFSSNSYLEKKNILNCSMYVQFDFVLKNIISKPNENEVRVSDISKLMS